jgi:hypothetical protein
MVRVATKVPWWHPQQIANLFWSILRWIALFFTTMLPGSNSQAARGFTTYTPPPKPSGSARGGDGPGRRPGSNINRFDDVMKRGNDLSGTAGGG